jgi:hypothetical protein
VASDNHLSVQGKGEIAVNIVTGHVQVKDVLHVPNLSENLMSVSQLVNKDFIVVFANEDCKIYHKNDVNLKECICSVLLMLIICLSLMATIWNGQMLVR